jgi:uncharacterized protein YlxW (UPF0749 family)
VKGRRGMSNYELQLFMAGGVVGFASSALIVILVNLLRSRREARRWKHEEEKRILDWKREDLQRKYEDLKREEERLVRTVEQKDAEINRLAGEEQRLVAENKQLRERIIGKLMGD